MGAEGVRPETARLLATAVRALHDAFGTEAARVLATAGVRDALLRVGGLRPRLRDLFVKASDELRAALLFAKQGGDPFYLLPTSVQRGWTRNELDRESGRPQLRQRRRGAGFLCRNQARRAQRQHTLCRERPRVADLRQQLHLGWEHA